MARPDVVTSDDIDFAIQDAEDAGTPDAVIERLLAAVENPALRSPDFSVGDALVAVSDLQMRWDRPVAAEATLRRAVAADSPDDLVDARAWLAAHLVDRGLADEAAREFAVLEASGRAGPDEYLVYGESLEMSGDFTAAVTVFAAGESAAERSADRSMARMLRRSADRARNGGVPAVPPPALARRPVELGDLAGERGDLADGEPVPELAAALFWSRAAHGRVVRAWPELGAEIGGDWDAHRAVTERGLIRAAEAGEVPVLVIGTYESFATHAGAHPTAATLDGYLRKHADELDLAEWPPERNAPCWCGSGQKYKRCCRPRGFAR